MTASELEVAARVRGELERVGLDGINNDDLDFCICLNERLSGQRETPCVPGEFGDA